MTFAREGLQGNLRIYLNLGVDSALQPCYNRQHRMVQVGEIASHFF